MACRFLLSAWTITTFLVPSLSACHDSVSSAGQTERSETEASLDDDLAQLVDQIDGLPVSMGLATLADYLRTNRRPSVWLDFLTFRSDWFNGAPQTLEVSQEGSAFRLCSVDWCVQMALVGEGGLTIDGAPVVEPSQGHGLGLQQWGVSCIGDSMWVFGMIADVAGKPNSVDVGGQPVAFRWLNPGVVSFSGEVDIDSSTTPDATIEVNGESQVSVSVHTDCTA